MRAKQFKSIGFLLLFLSGCARVPDSDLAHLSDPIPLDQSLELALERDFFEEGGWPNDRWWEMFSDPQLNDLIARALIESPTLSRAQALVAEAEQEARKEKSALFPRLDFDYLEQWQYFSKNGFDRSFFPTPPGSPPIPATDNQIDLSLYFNYEIDFFGKNQNLFKAALGKARAERAEAAQATLMLTTHIVQTYIELQTKLSQLQILNDRKDLRTELFALTVSRGVHGIDPAIPILEKEKDIYEIEKARLTLEKEIAIDRHLLSILVGAGPDSNVAPDTMNALFEKPLPLPADLSSDLLARRPDLTAQIWRVEAAAKEIGAAQADFYPRVNLMAFAQLESLTFNKLLKIGSRQGGLVPAVHLPIFTGGKLTANLKGKVAAFNEETYRYNELLLSAAKEVADGIVTLSATHDRVGFQVDRAIATDQQFELQQSRYNRGINDLLSVLEREENALIERYHLLGLERDYLLATVKIVKALGGGYHTSQSLPRGRD